MDGRSRKDTIQLSMHVRYIPVNVSTSYNQSKLARKLTSAPLSYTDTKLCEWYWLYFLKLILKN